MYGQLEAVQALVAAGADPAAISGGGHKLFVNASSAGHTDVVTFLLQLPAISATINHIIPHQGTAISCASFFGRLSTVQLLLDASADPTIPPGRKSPLSQATSPRPTWYPPLTENHYTVAALLRNAIAEPDRVRALHKARSLFGAGAAALACLQGQVKRGKGLPQLGFTLRDWSNNEKLRETAAFAAGMSGGEKDSGLCDELYVELQAYMVHAWADTAAAGLRERDRVKKEERRLIRKGVVV